MVKVYTFTNQDHKRLLDEYFFPTASQDKNAEVVPIFTNLPGGNVNSPAFIPLIAAKMQAIIDSLKGPSDEFVIWSDADIIFYPPFNYVEEAIKELDIYEIAFQREWHNSIYANTGFFIARKTEHMVKIFEHLLRAVSERENKLNEQAIVNNMQNNGSKFHLLSPKFLTNTYRRKSKWTSIPKDTLMFHANWTYSLQEKIDVLNEFGKKSET